jgi:hypothetical protein
VAPGTSDETDRFGPDAGRDDGATSPSCSETD